MKSRDSKPREGGSRRHLMVGLGLCLVTLAVYSNSFGAGFAMDNRGLILQDTRIQAATAENLDLIMGHTYWWPYGESGLFRPLTTLSYLFNYAVLGNGEGPAGYHWLNYVLHAVNVLLVYALGLRLTDWRRAGWVAGLWAVHPLLTESVTNIVGRADLLAGIGVLGGLLVYLKSTEASGARRWGYLAALAALTAIGVFSKESAVMLLPLVCLYEAVYWRERRGKGLLYGVLAMLIPIEAMLYQRGAVLWAATPSTFPVYDNPIVGAGWLEGRLTALNVMGRYLGLLLWPWKLSADYSWAQIPPGGGDWMSWVVLLGVAAAGIWLWRGDRLAWFVAGAAVLVFLPTSNLLFPIGSIMAERFLYLPAIAFTAGLVAILSKLEGRAGMARVLPAVLGLVAIGWGGRTWARNVDWQTELSLASATAAAAPGSYKSHLMLAFSLFEADPGHANIDTVLAEGEKSLAILDPLPVEQSNASALRRTAAWYLAKADRLRPPGQKAAMPPEGAQACRRALELLQRCRTMIVAQAAAAARLPGFDPRMGAPSELRDVDGMISSVYLRLGDTGRALELSAGAIEADPTNSAVYRQYAQSLLAAGRTGEAVTVLMTGVMLTMDAGLRQNVVELFQANSEPGDCSLMPGQNGAMVLNPRCEKVHVQLCAATVAAIQLRMKGGRRDFAEQLKGMGVKDFGCPVADLDAAMGR